MSDEAPSPSGRAEHVPFRWQALLQRAAEAVFVLDRRRRLLFVNSAWERLTGMPADQARGLLCRRPRPAGADAPLEDVLSHLFTPPREVLRGAFGRARRLFPERAPETALRVPRWWDVEFLPLGLGPEEGYLILGRVLPLPSAGERDPGQPAPVLPERLMDLRQRWVGSFTLDLLAGPRPVLQRLRRQVRLASSVQSPVLLLGEQGTGKKTLARIIHYQGPACDRCLMALDCRRLPPAIVAGLLFDEAGQGRTVPGAIYLDEPAHLPRDVQLRLAERLANNAADEEAAAAPRLMAGSSTRPEEDIRAGRLLEDLHCLLSPLTIEVPPLRQRLDDLPRLVESMLSGMKRDGQYKAAGLTPAAWEVMRHHTWPGNLAELRQVLFDACNRASSERIDAGDLPAALRLAQRVEQTPIQAAAKPVPLQERLEQVERRLIQLALQRARGNRSRAAELLGIYRGRLLRRMEALGMETGEEET